MGARFLRESDLGAQKQGSVVDLPPRQPDPAKMTDSFNNNKKKSIEILEDI